MIEVTIKTIDGHNRKFTLNGEMTIFELKMKILEEMDIPLRYQRLIFMGKVLQDAKTLTECGDINGKVIHLVHHPPPTSVTQPNVSNGGRSSHNNPSSLNNAGRNRVPPAEEHSAPITQHASTVLTPREEMQFPPANRATQPAINIPFALLYSNYDAQANSPSSTNVRNVSESNPQPGVNSLNAAMPGNRSNSQPLRRNSLQNLFHSLGEVNNQLRPLMEQSQLLMSLNPTFRDGVLEVDGQTLRNDVAGSLNLMSMICDYVNDEINQFNAARRPLLSSDSSPESSPVQAPPIQSLIQRLHPRVLALATTARETSDTTERVALESTAPLFECLSFDNTSPYATRSSGTTTSSPFTEVPNSTLGVATSSVSTATLSNASCASLSNRFAENHANHDETTSRYFPRGPSSTIGVDASSTSSASYETPPSRFSGTPITLSNESTSSDFPRDPASTFGVAASSTSSASCGTTDPIFKIPATMSAPSCSTISTQTTGPCATVATGTLAATSSPCARVTAGNSAATTAGTHAPNSSLKRHVPHLPQTATTVPSRNAASALPAFVSNEDVFDSSEANAREPEVELTEQSDDSSDVEIVWESVTTVRRSSGDAPFPSKRSRHH